MGNQNWNNNNNNNDGSNNSRRRKKGRNTSNSGGSNSGGGNRSNNNLNQPNTYRFNCGTSPPTYAAMTSSIIVGHTCTASTTAAAPASTWSRDINPTPPHTCTNGNPANS